MSLGSKQDFGFDSLLGHTVTFMVEERRTDLVLAGRMVDYLMRKKLPCTVLDADALYASNSEYIFGPLPEDYLRRVELLVPDVGSNLGEELAQLLDVNPRCVLIIDSLNSVFHLLPGDGRGSKNRGLAFILALFSYFARADRRTVFLTMYRRGSESEGRRPISGLSDERINVSFRDGILALEGRLGAWQERESRSPTP